MDEGRAPRFARPRALGSKGASPHLFVANCGPRVGISLDRIAQAFGGFGNVVAVRTADESGARVIVSFAEVASARAAMVALNGARCPHLDDRLLHVSYSSQVPFKVKTEKPVPVSLVASDLGIPGIHLWHEFVSKEEEKLLVTDHGKLLQSKGFSIMAMSFFMRCTWGHADVISGNIVILKGANIIKKANCCS